MGVWYSDYALRFPVKKIFFEPFAFSGNAGFPQFRASSL
jgi:hypothetical protein